MHAILLPLIVLFAVSAAAESPARVTTDSVEYCFQLFSRLSVQPPDVLASVRGLAEEGMRLCETGRTRSGISKLRRALRIVQGAGS